MAEISAALVGLGIDGARVHTEIFGAAPASTPGIAAAPSRPPHPPAGPPGDGPEVAFARSGLTVRWGAGYGSLLELAEACDVPVRWSCRSGVCHTCETGADVRNGHYAPDPIDEPAEGSALICCSQPSADLVLDLFAKRRPPSTTRGSLPVPRGPRGPRPSLPPSEREVFREDRARREDRSARPLGGTGCSRKA